MEEELISFLMSIYNRLRSPITWLKMMLFVFPDNSADVGRLRFLKHAWACAPRAGGTTVQIYLKPRHAVRCTPARYVWYPMANLQTRFSGDCQPGHDFQMTEWRLFIFGNNPERLLGFGYWLSAVDGEKHCVHFPDRCWHMVASKGSGICTPGPTRLTIVVAARERPPILSKVITVDDRLLTL